MKVGVLLCLLVAPALVASAAHADEKVACADAALKGQTLGRSHQLLEAREQLRVCAQATCPALVQTDCASWLADVEKALPTVVITAKDAAGDDLTDVKVSANGRPLATKLRGESVPLDPGLYSLHFETADGLTADREALVKEGLKSQELTAVLMGAPLDHVEVPHGSPWRTVGWVAGAVGVVGLGVGIAFGFSAMSDKSSAHCSAAGVCESGPLGDARTSATISTSGIVAGGVLLAGGAALVLWAPKGNASSSANLKVAPLVGARDGRLLLTGSW
jgi:hypothetical protein